MNATSKEKQEMLLNVFMDCFSDYFQKRSYKEVARNTRYATMRKQCSGKQFSGIVGELIFEQPICDNEMPGNFGVKQKLMKLEIMPQISTYTCSYKIERASCSDIMYHSPHALSRDVLAEVSKLSNDALRKASNEWEAKRAN